MKQKQELNQDYIINFLKESPIRVAVFGEFSCGKSTFINALMGEDILSVAVDPTTAVPVFIRYGREFNIFVNLSKGDKLKLFEDDPPFWARFVGRAGVLNTLKKQQATIKDFLKHWTTEGKRADEVDNIAIELSLDWLESGIELIDTPGTNVEFTKHQHFTEKVAKETDIAIMLMDARHGGGKRTEFKLMNSIQKQVSQSFLVLNKMDMLNSNEREDILEFVKNDALPNHWEGAVPPQLFGLSAKVRIEQEITKSEKYLTDQFEKFIKEVEKIIGSERGKILLHRLGNPDKALFNKAKVFEKNNVYDKAHKIYFDLHDILKIAELNTKPALDGIQRCEENLAEQVTTLDAINGEINRSLEMEQVDPDLALDILNNAHDKLTELKLSNEIAEIKPVIERLSNRINIRDIARKKIKSIKQNAKKHHSSEDYIESVDEIEKINKQITKAELSASQLKNITGAITSYTKERDEWTEKEWNLLTDKAEYHIKQHDYQTAKELIPELRRIQPFVTHIDNTSEFIRVMRKKCRDFESYVQLSERIENDILPKLKTKMLDPREILKNYPKLRLLKECKEGLFDKPSDLHLPLVLENHLYLTIDQKISIAHYIKENAAQPNKINHAITLLMNRKAKLDQAQVKRSDIENNIHLFTEYPDHPEIVQNITQITKYKHSYLTTPSKIQHVKKLLVTLDHSTNMVLKPRIEELSVIYKEQAKKYLVSSWLVFFTIIFIAYGFYSNLNNNRLYQSLDTMNVVEKLETLNKLYNSWGFRGDTELYLDRDTMFSQYSSVITKKYDEQDDRYFEYAILLSKIGRFEGAIEIAEKIEGYKSYSALYKIANELVENEHFGKAIKIRGKHGELSYRKVGVALTRLIVEKQAQLGLFQDAIITADYLEEVWLRNDMYEIVAEAQIEKGLFSEVITTIYLFDKYSYSEKNRLFDALILKQAELMAINNVFSAIELHTPDDDDLLTIVRHFAEVGYFSEVKLIIDEIRDEDWRDYALVTSCLKKAEHGFFQGALSDMSLITNKMKLIEASTGIAVSQAKVGLREDAVAMFNQALEYARSIKGRNYEELCSVALKQSEAGFNQASLKTFQIIENNVDKYNIPCLIISHVALQKANAGFSDVSKKTFINAHKMAEKIRSYDDKQLALANIARDKALAGFKEEALTEFKSIINRQRISRSQSASILYQIAVRQEEAQLLSDAIATLQKVKQKQYYLDSYLRMNIENKINSILVKQKLTDKTK